MAAVYFPQRLAVASWGANITLFALSQPALGKTSFLCQNSVVEYRLFDFLFLFFSSY